MWHQTIPEHYVERIVALLHQVPWKEYIKGLGSGLTITDMADFLSQEWLSDLHIHTMLAATRRLHHHALSCADSSIEIASPDFPYHVFMSDLLATTPISPNYSDLAPKSVIRLGNALANVTNGLRIAAVTFSLPNHWACLFVDSQAKTIH
jgi:hypothetical protein